MKHILMTLFCNPHLRGLWDIVTYLGWFRCDLLAAQYWDWLRGSALHLLLIGYHNICDTFRVKVLIKFFDTCILVPRHFDLHLWLCSWPQLFWMLNLWNYHHLLFVAKLWICSLLLLFSLIVWEKAALLWLIFSSASFMYFENFVK